MHPSLARFARSIAWLAQFVFRHWMFAFSLVFGLALSQLPLFSEPGYETSIASGLMLPTLVAIAVAVRVASMRTAKEKTAWSAQTEALKTAFSAAGGFALDDPLSLHAGSCIFGEARSRCF